MPTTTPFNNLITFSRGSNATVTGSNGLIQWAPNNLPTFSEQFDNVNWPKENITVIANTAIAPDGSSTAELMYPTTTGNNRRIIRSTTLTVGTVYAQSVYVKAAGKRWVYLNGIDATTAANNCWFDLQDGVVGTKGGSVLSAGISAVGDGWYRIFTVGAAGANNYFYLMGVDADNSLVSTTNGTDGILIWGAQLEIGSTATTYNPTTVKNLLGFSEAFDNAFWVKTRASIVTSAAANPVNGLFNAQKLMEDTTASNSHVITGAGGTVGSVETLSVYARAAGRQWLTFQIGTTASAYFNIGTGVLGTVTNGTASIVNIGGGWYRCSLTATRAGTTNNFIFLASADLTVNYTGDGNSGVYIYGAQLSDSASLDPYVPTPGAAPSSTAFYGPRFDFDPVTLQPRGILIEEQRTNRTLQSENFTVSPWDATIGGTSTRTNGTNALGFTEGVITATSASGGIRQQHPSLASGQVYALSFYIQSTATAVNLLFENGTATFGGPHTVVINPANGTAGALTGFTSATVQPFGPGYIYTLITAPAGGGLLANIEWRILNNGDVIRLGRPQFEAGAFATSYIPTVASTATRSADVATISGQNFAQWYRQDEGSFVAEYLATIDAAGTYRTQVQARNAGSTNFNQIRNANLTPTTAIVNSQVVVTTAQADLQSATLTGGAALKTSLAYRVNDFAAVTNGATPITDTSGSVASDLSLLVLGGGTFSVGQTWFRSIRFIPARAADFQLQALTELPLVPTLDLDFLNNLYEA